MNEAYFTINSICIVQVFTQFCTHLSIGGSCAMSEEIDKHKAMNQGNLFITYSLPLPVSYSTPALLFHAWTNQIGKCAIAQLTNRLGQENSQDSF